MDIVTFQVGDYLYGFPAIHVCRVLEETDIFPVPFMPPCHLGLLLYRGEIFDVIDAGILLIGQASHAGRASRILLLKWEDERLGVIPDAVVGLVCSKGKKDFGEQKIEILKPQDLMKMVMGTTHGFGKIS